MAAQKNRVACQKSEILNLVAKWYRRDMVCYAGNQFWVGAVLNKLYQISSVVDAINNPQFLRVFAETLSSIASASFLTVFVYEKNKAPIHLFDNFDSDGSKEAIRTYLKETYRINPFYIEYCRGVAPGIYQLEDLKASVANTPPEISRKLNGKVIVTQDEELGYVTKNWPQRMTEIECVVPVGAGRILAATVYRDRNFEVPLDDFAEPLEEYFPLLAASLRQFWHCQGDRYIAVDNLTPFGEKTDLTKRESEVTSLILKGHSSASIGLVLGISVTTVKSHRKTVYQKLGISSQAELMSIYIDKIRETLAHKLG